MDIWIRKTIGLGVDFMRSKENSLREISFLKDLPIIYLYIVMNLIIIAIVVISRSSSSKKKLYQKKPHKETRSGRYDGNLHRNTSEKRQHASDHSRRDDARCKLPSIDHNVTFEKTSRDSCTISSVMASGYMDSSPNSSHENSPFPIEQKTYGFAPEKNGFASEKNERSKEIPITSHPPSVQFYDGRMGLDANFNTERHGKRRLSRESEKWNTISRRASAGYHFEKEEESLVEVSRKSSSLKQFSRGETMMTQAYNTQTPYVEDDDENDDGGKHLRECEAFIKKMQVHALHERTESFRRYRERLYL